MFVECTRTTAFARLIWVYDEKLLKIPSSPADAQSYDYFHIIWQSTFYQYDVENDASCPEVRSAVILKRWTSKQQTCQQCPSRSIKFLFCPSRTSLILSSKFETICLVVGMKRFTRGHLEHERSWHQIQCPSPTSWLWLAVHYQSKNHRLTFWQVAFLWIVAL